MLNELYDLWQACEPPGKPPRIDLPPRIQGLDAGQRAEGVRVFIREDGTVSRVERVQADDMKRIRKWTAGKGNSLPVFNFEPLLFVPDESLKRLSAELRKLGVGKKVPFPKAAKLRWPRSSKKRTITKDLATAFGKVSADILRRVGSDDDTRGDAWRALLGRLSGLDARMFLCSLTKKLWHEVRSGNGEPVFLKLLLFSGAGKPKKIPVQFEAEGNFSHHIYSAAAQAWLSERLVASIGEKNGPAIWGSSCGAYDLYGVVGLPIGEASIFNRNVGEKPTSIRYADGDAALFPVGQDVRMKLMASIEWLTQPERNRKTWLVRSKFGKPEKKTKMPPPFLLLSYLNESINESPDHLAELFMGPPDEEADRATVQFETICKGIADAIDGIPNLSQAARINVFALHKPDPARVQVFFSEAFHASQLKHFAEKWQANCQKYPAITILQFPTGPRDNNSNLELSSLKELDPLIPSPYRAIECLNTNWEKCGKADDAKCESASDYGLADAFELLRRTGAHPTDAAYLGRMLVLAVRRALPLMTAVGQAMHQAPSKRHEQIRVFIARGDKARHATKSMLHARYWPCLFSLLLTRLGYNLETYMKEPAYLIGRFLAQLDRLHGYYAKHVSGKEDGLRQLLGNSLMSTALESPLRAFELAGQRMLPYQAWGHSFAQGRKSKDALGAASDEFKAINRDKWEVHRILQELGQVAKELSDCGIPETNRAGLPDRVGHEAKLPTKPVLDLVDTLKANDRAWMHADSAAKAQMLLGYLARPVREQTAAAGAAKMETPPIAPDFE
jgi:hypothetical protein